MTISFERRNDELILCYAPAMGTRELEKRLFEGEELQIKHTFNVNSSMLRESDEYDFEETLRFCIGKIGDEYTEIDSDIIGTNHRFFFSNDITLKAEMFVAYRNISILRKIDDIIETDFYAGGKWDTVGGMPFEAYKAMLLTFPKSAELDKYAHSRIANCIKEYFPECDKYNVFYEQFILRKSKREPFVSVLSKTNLEIELAQFSSALAELQSMVSDYSGYTETVWQIKIQEILRLLYPKYILSIREIVFKGIDGYDKRPDFVLVDTNGYIDILEIKKPDMQILTKQASFRNNYVPVRAFSGTIQQIEKYVFCLTSIEKSRNEVIKKVSELLPDTISPDIVNPQGIMIAGRSCHFNPQQKRDYELIKRQNKHVADIMTYDDLISRFKNIVDSLENRIVQKGSPAFARYIPEK